MSGPQSDPAAPKRAGRGLRFALIASLAVNLLFLGLIAGGAMTAAQRTGGPPVGPDLRALWRAMPDESRQTLRAEMRDPSGDGQSIGREERRALLAAREAEMLSLLRAETFDAGEFAALLEERRATMAAHAETAQAAFVAHLATLDASERMALADRYESRRSRRSAAR